MCVRECVHAYPTLETGVKVDLSDMNLKSIPKTLKRLIDRDDKSVYKQLWYQGNQRVVLHEAVKDTVDERRVWPLKPDHIGLGPDDLKKKKSKKKSPWVRWLSWCSSAYDNRITRTYGQSHHLLRSLEIH